MEGEKEEKKQSNDSAQPGQEVARPPQPQKTDGTSEDGQDLPIMHWEALSLRIAELEKLEEERRERAKCVSGLEGGCVSGLRAEARLQGFQDEGWGGEEDCGRVHVTLIASRFHQHKNLQLCFINNSESESEEEEEGAAREGSKEAGGHGNHPSGLKVEVRAALGALRAKLRAEQEEEEHLPCSGIAARRKHLDHSDLMTFTLRQLGSLRASLQQDVHDLSSELVGHLLIRDQLRTKQDAMLLDVQDMT